MNSAQEAAVVVHYSGMFSYCTECSETIDEYVWENGTQEYKEYEHKCFCSLYLPKLEARLG